MIPEQTLLNFPVFGDNATKVEPDNNKKSAGWQQADVVPAEWMNWEWYHASKGVSDLNDGLTSVESEINNVLSENGITPNVNNNDQLYKAMRMSGGVIMASSKTITNAPSIASGNVIKIMFTADITGTDITTGLLISYNGSAKPVKVCQNGVLADVLAHEITTGTYKYIQAYTTLEFVYDGVNFVIIGNPVVISGDDFKVYADGKVGDEPVGTVRALSSSTVPYGWAIADGHQISRTKYAKLFTKYNTETWDSDPTHTLIIRYGIGNGETTFNLPDYRETVLVGIGTNTRDISVTAQHDVFTLGEFKLDQVQIHAHYLVDANGTKLLSSKQGPDTSGGQITINYGTPRPNTSTALADDFYSGRGGSVTRTKEKGVVYIVKVL